MIISIRCVSIILCRLERLNLVEIGDDDNAFRHFTHPPVQACLIFIMSAHAAIEVDGVDAKKNIEVVIQQRRCSA